MDAILEQFKDFLKEQDRAAATISGYLNDLSLFKRWLNKPWDTIISADVRNYRQEMLNQSAAARTINRKLAALAAFGAWATHSGILKENPALKIRSVETTTIAPRWLEKKERSALVQAIRDDLQKSQLRYPRLWLLRLRDAVCVTLLLNTGLRVSELCNLKMSDLLLTERKSTLTVRAGKGTKQRVVPINRDARQMLEQWLATHPQTSDNFLFSGQRGERMQVRSVQLAITRLSKAAGLEGVTCHVCRHTFAKSLLDNGVTLEKVATLLGHESLDTTRLYVTPGERDLEQAVGSLVE